MTEDAAASGRDGSTGAAPPGRRRWVALGVLAAGLAMIVMDGTIVGVSLPRIISDLGLDLADAQWVTSAYSVVFAALLLIFGRLADRLGRKTIFLIGVVVFALASLGAGLAQGASSLIALRVAQAVGGAMILPTTLSTVNATFRGKDRAAAFGVWGAVMAGSAALGPLLGGALTSALSWRWIFFVNLPIAAVIVVLGAKVVDQSHDQPKEPGLDILGPILSALGFALIVFGLIEGNSLGWWKPTHELDLGPIAWGTSAPISPVAPALALGLLLVLAFIAWERHRTRTGRAALLDLRLFRIGSFSWGNLTAMAVAVGEFALTFTLPLYLVNAAGLSIMKSGLVLAFMALGAFVAGAQARHVAGRFGAARTVIGGLVLELVGTAVTLLLVWAQASTWFVALGLLVYGVGLGFASAQLTSTVLSQVPPEQSGAGSATQSTVRQIGAALGSAVAGSALAIGLKHNLPAALDGVGVSGVRNDQLVQATVDSAGGLIGSMRGSGVGEVLRTGFAEASAISMGVAVAFLAIGLVGAFRVAAATSGPRVSPVPESTGGGGPESESPRPQMG